METMYRPFVEPIGREETEFFAVGADEHCPKVAVFVGGNPGYAGLYGQFLQKLSQSLGSDWRVLGASLLGHEGSNVHEHKRFTFSDQVEHFCCTLEEIAFGRERLVVLGHSIGAAVGLQAAEQGSLLSDERFSFTLLMPFLEFSELVPGQRRLRYLAWAPWARWVAYIPGRLQMLVALAACGFRMDPLAEEHLERFLSDRSGMGLENVISLARSEFAHLAGAMETHCQILRRLGRRACIVHADGDMWLPERQLAAVKASADTCNFIPAGDGVKHAFCLDEGQSTRMAQLVANHIHSRDSLPRSEM